MEVKTGVRHLRNVLEEFGNALGDKPGGHDETLAFAEMKVFTWRALTHHRGCGFNILANRRDNSLPQVPDRLHREQIDLREPVRQWFLLERVRCPGRIFGLEPGVDRLS